MKAALKDDTIELFHLSILLNVDCCMIEIDVYRINGRTVVMLVYTEGI
jgi:hypothetical protein